MNTKNTNTPTPNPDLLIECADYLMSNFSYEDIIKSIEDAAAAKKAEEAIQKYETELNEARKTFIAALFNYVACIEPEIKENCETIETAKWEEALIQIEQIYATIKAINPSIDISEMSSDDIGAIIRTMLA